MQQTAFDPLPYRLHMVLLFYSPSDRQWDVLPKPKHVVPIHAHTPMHCSSALMNVFLHACPVAYPNSLTPLPHCCHSNRVHRTSQVWLVRAALASASSSGWATARRQAQKLAAGSASAAEGAQLALAGAATSVLQAPHWLHANAGLPNSR